MTLQEMRDHFFRLYGRRNRIFLSGLRERIDFFNLAIGDLQEAIRKEYGSEIIGVALARIVARIFCIAENFWSLPFVETMARKYPVGHCSYCQQFPCVCPERRAMPTLERSAQGEQLQWGLRDWQNYFKDLYGKRNKKKGIENLLNRLFKELGELLSLQMTLPTTKDSVDKIEEEFALELADMLAWTIAIANFLKIDLEAAVLKRFGNDCWHCHEIPCVCGAFDMKPVRWEEIY